MKAGGVNGMTTEAPVSQRSQLVLARMGALPMRNNVGVAVDDTGRHIRYGLMNTSAQQNKQFKSSDIIAPVPVLVTQEMVGTVVALFGAFETKRPGWHLTPGDERGQAQLRFINLMCSVGAVAGFVTDPERDIARIIRRER